MGHHLHTFRRLGISWSDYRKKVPSTLLIRWGNAMAECRRIGYYNPEGVMNGDKWDIQWYQARDMVNTHQETRAMETLCSRCEKRCRQKDDKGVHKEGYTPCWK